MVDTVATTVGSLEYKQEAGADGTAVQMQVLVGNRQLLYSSSG